MAEKKVAVAAKVAKVAKPVAAKEKPINGTQVKLLKALVKHGPLPGGKLAEKAGVDPTVIGNQAGYHNPEINQRPVHANNLLNRGMVRVKIAEDGPNLYEVTAAGKKAAQ